MCWDSKDRFLCVAFVCVVGFLYYKPGETITAQQNKEQLLKLSKRLPESSHIWDVADERSPLAQQCEATSLQQQKLILALGMGSFAVFSILSKNWFQQIFTFSNEEVWKSTDDFMLSTPESFFTDSIHMLPAKWQKTGYCCYFTSPKQLDGLPGDGANGLR